ncbi:MAG: hypothetical protein VYC17_05595 [Nitrospinota bacterium]|nr:hypothetical protein [Nitrospinota bacterium]
MPDHPLSPEDSNGKKNRLPGDLEALGEFREALDDLKDYIESRKESLEEEIEGQLHESVRNANDCLERIQETLEPKFEKMVLKEMEDIDRKVVKWTKESNARLSEEIRAETAGQAGKVQANLEAKFRQKLEQLADELVEKTNANLEADLKKQIQEMRRRQKILAVVTTILVLTLGLLTIVTKF